MANVVDQSKEQMKKVGGVHQGRTLQASAQAEPIPLCSTASCGILWRSHPPQACGHHWCPRASHTFRHTI